MKGRKRLHKRYLRQAGLEFRTVRRTGIKAHTAGVVRALLQDDAFWDAVDQIEESRDFAQPGRPAEWPAWIHALYQFTILYVGGIEATERFYRNYWDELRAIALTEWPDEPSRRVPKKQLSANTFTKARCRRDRAGRSLDLRRLRIAALETAVANCAAMGLGTDSEGGTRSSPARGRVLVGDATPIASMIQNRTEAYVDRVTGEIRERRVDHDARIVHNGGDKTTWGYSALQVAIASNVDGEHNRSQVLFRTIYQGHHEGDAVCDILDELIPLFGDGIQGVAYDGAFRGKHFDRIMERHGVPVIGKIRADSRETFVGQFPVDGGRRPRTIAVYGFRGDAYTKAKDAAGKTTKFRLTCKRFERRANRPKSAYKGWGIFEVPEVLGGGTVRVPYLNPNNVADTTSPVRWSEALMPFGENHKDRARLNGIRGTIESLNWQMKNETKVDRSFAFTMERTELDIVCHQILRNALSAAAWIGCADADASGGGGGGSPSPTDDAREAIAA